MFNRILTTANKIQVKIGDKIEDTDELKPYQTVIACGETSRVKEGDIVLIDPERYKKQKRINSPIEGTRHTQERVEFYFDFDSILINDIDYLFFYDNDVKGIIKVEEFEPQSSLLLAGNMSDKSLANLKDTKRDPKGLLETI